jgi:hypothetical protein
MRPTCLLIAAAFLLGPPARASAQPAAPVAESTLPHSKVSLMVEPALSDGRLVIRLAAKNLTAAAVPFGPSMVSVAKPSGQAIALYPLTALINDVRAAAGMALESPVTNVPTAGAYAAPQLGRQGGRVDVTGYTGGAAIGGDEYVRRNQARRGKATISEADAQAQITALRQAILQDSSVAPGQIAVGQVVSDKLKFAKGEERLLHVRVRIAGDEHSFTIAAPQS